MPSDISIKRQCVFIAIKKTDSGVLCRCGRCKFKWLDTAGHFPSNLHRDCPGLRLGLGDAIAAALSWIGITEESWATRPVVCGGFFGTWQRLEPKEKPCGCSVRQERLNRCSFTIEEKADGIIWWFRHRINWVAEKITRRGS